MKTFPGLILVAALVALDLLPFSFAAVSTILFGAALAFIMHADYALRHRRVRLPKLARPPRSPRLPRALRRQRHPLAA